MGTDRRAVLAGGAALLAGLEWTEAARAEPAAAAFPVGFLWGAATAGHQVEGNNTNSDTWFLEHQKPSVFKESSGDACNSLRMWGQDLDLVKSFGLNTYRFSIEWARIEPAPGEYSIAMLDHYRAMIDGCHERGLCTDGDLQPLHVPAMVWCSRRLAQCGGAGDFRALLRASRASPGKRDRLCDDAQ